MFIPQDSRFIIYEDFGCSSSISTDAVGTLLGILPQLLIGLVCTVYSSASIQYFLYLPETFLLKSSDRIPSPQEACGAQGVAF